MSRRQRDARAEICRRAVIAAPLGLAAAVPEPLSKLSQRAAAYQDTPKGMFRCALCTFFIRPRGCKVVSGDISPAGWCRLFDLAD